jgi:hypothetical protein
MTDVAKLPSAPKYYDNLLPHELANLLPMIEGIKFAD